MRRALNKHITVKRRFNLKCETRRSLPNCLEFGKIEKRQSLTPLFGSATSAGECINIETLKRLVFQGLCIDIQIAPHDRKFAFSPSSTKRMRHLAIALCSIFVLSLGKVEINAICLF